MLEKNDLEKVSNHFIFNLLELCFKNLIVFAFLISIWHHQPAE